MVKARKYVVKNLFKGLPKESDYELVEEELPALKDDEILVKTEYISVDPYQKAYNENMKPPYDQFGLQVGEVIETRASDFPVGTKVVSHRGWCDYAIISTKTAFNPMDRTYKVPELLGMPVTLAIGAVGMVGAAAYFGFLELCQPKAGETVVVTGAAGAVGSIVGQIAKIKGCKVIGFTGSDAKVEWLEKQLGFDKAFNYKSVDAAEVLKEAAPRGIDCYFDNVGGELSSVIINKMNDFGRVSVCGSISSYNDSSLPKATILQPALVVKQLKCEGFIVSRWVNRWPEAFADLAKWVKEGKIVTREHVTEGFENTIDAFIGMLSGENMGKAIVKV